MHPIVEKFLDYSALKKAGILAGVLLISGGAFYQLGLSPLLEEHTKLSETRAKLEQQLANEKRIARNLPKYEEQVKALEIKLRLALQELPDRKQIDQLLASVSDLARKAGLEVTLFKPDGVVPKDFYEEVPVSMSVDGNYHQIATFFDEVGRMDRIVNIRGIEMAESKLTDKGASLKANCTAVTYRFLDEAERAKIEGQSDNQKKRRR